MVANVMAPSGLDACWFTRDLVDRIDQCAKDGGAVARLTAGGLTGLVALSDLDNAGIHLVKAVAQLPLAVLVTIGRLVGLDAAKQSDYDLTRVALHVTRTLAFATEAGVCGTIGIPFAVAKPSAIVALHRDLGLNATWENSGSLETWRTRVDEYCHMAQDGVKKAWGTTRDFGSLVISNKNPALTIKVIGALVGTLGLVGGTALALSSTGTSDGGPNNHDVPDNGGVNNIVIVDPNKVKPNDDNQDKKHKVTSGEVGVHAVLGLGTVAVAYAMVYRLVKAVPVLGMAPA